MINVINGIKDSDTIPSSETYFLEDISEDKFEDFVLSLQSQISFGINYIADDTSELTIENDETKTLLYALFDPTVKKIQVSVEILNGEIYFSFDFLTNENVLNEAVIKNQI